jgi:hypothetical protein
MAWEIEFTDEFGDWWSDLTVEQQEAIAQRVALLAAKGPSLRRPYVGEIKGSAHDPQMKELRIGEGGALRILFVFDPRRTAILLFGGNKTGQWNAWYSWAVPAADLVYKTYLAELREEGEF